MKTKLPIILVSILVITAFVVTDSFSQNQNDIISVIPNSDMEYGCGCAYVLKPIDKKNYKFIFFSEFGFDKPKMRINEQMVALEPVTIQQIPSDPKIGDEFSQTYRYGSVELQFDNKIIFVCPPGDEGCEVTTYDSVLTVKEGNDKKVYQVQGDCGC